MRYKIYFALLLTSIFLGGILAATGHDGLAIGAMGAAAVVAALLYRSAVKPMEAVRNGMDLLRSQDFASRLRYVGQADADRAVELFNGMMQAMKTERLRNLEQNAFLSKLVEASPMGIAVCDMDRNIIETNPAFRVLEYDGLGEALEHLEEGHQATVRAPGGEILRLSRMFFMDRGFKRIFFLVELLTDEIMKAETAMFHKIVRTMGHEVNNTLGGVVSMLESLAEMHADDMFVVEAIGSCRASCLALRDFVKAYSDIVKLPEASLSEINPRELLHGIEGFLKAMCAPGITLEIDASEANPIMADAMLLERVIVNAVKNSVESIGAGQGTVKILAAGKRIEIIDNGPGIKPENASNVFTPFFSTKNADRGLGLMLISDILRKHKARYSLSTRPDGLTALTMEF